jgi:hypothetical protein
MVLDYGAVLYGLVLIEVLVEDSTICSPSRAVVEETEVPARDVNPSFLISSALNQRLESPRALTYLKQRWSCGPSSWVPSSREDLDTLGVS